MNLCNIKVLFLDLKLLDIKVIFADMYFLC
jgi:hypothetical protein